MGEVISFKTRQVIDFGENETNPLHFCIPNEKKIELKVPSKTTLEGEYLSFCRGVLCDDDYLEDLVNLTAENMVELIEQDECLEEAERLLGKQDQIIINLKKENKELLD